MCDGKYITNIIVFLIFPLVLLIEYLQISDYVMLKISESLIINPWIVLTNCQRYMFFIFTQRNL